MKRSARIIQIEDSPLPLRVNSCSETTWAVRKQNHLCPWVPDELVEGHHIYGSSQPRNEQDPWTLGTWIQSCNTFGGAGIVDLSRRTPMNLRLFCYFSRVQSCWPVSSFLVACPLEANLRRPMNSVGQRLLMIPNIYKTNWLSSWSPCWAACTVYISFSSPASTATWLLQLQKYYWRWAGVSGGKDVKTSRSGAWCPEKLHRDG